MDLRSVLREMFFAVLPGGLLLPESSSPFINLRLNVAQAFCPVSLSHSQLKPETDPCLFC